MKLRYTSYTIVLTVFSVIAGCATSTDIISEKSVDKKVESNNDREEELNTLRNFERLQNKTNKVSEFKIVHLPERPGE